MLYRVIKILAYKFYLLGKIVADKKNAEDRINELKLSLTVADYSYIDKIAYIQNSQAKPDKIRIGEKSSIKGHLMLFRHGGEISVGNYSFIGEGTKIWSAKKIVIGNNVLIAHNVNIHDNISHPLNSSLRHKDYLHIIESGFQEEIDLREEEVIIEDDVWIGFNSTILKGVRIGTGAIIGACTVITENVPPFAVVIGNPPRIVKYVE